MLVEKVKDVSIKGGYLQAHTGYLLLEFVCFLWIKKKSGQGCDV